MNILSMSRQCGLSVKYRSFEFSSVEYIIISREMCRKFVNRPANQKCSEKLIVETKETSLLNAEMNRQNALLSCISFFFFFFFFILIYILCKTTSIVLNFSSHFHKLILHLYTHHILMIHKILFQA